MGCYMRRVSLGTNVRFPFLLPSLVLTPPDKPPDELIDNLVPPLEFIRDKLAKQYLKMGGFMCAEDGKPKDLRDFVRLAEKGMWTAVSPEVQAFTQRTLAVSLQKLMEVFVRLSSSGCLR